MDNGLIIIAGLGNPEKNYKNTRHNMGFEVVNKLSYDYNIEINRAKFKAHFGEGRMCGKKVMLVKPQTYMNLSGESIRSILSYYKQKPGSLIVVYDDVDLAPGVIRVRERGSAGSHNGMKNIIYQLETDEFIRVRVGIGRNPDKMPLEAYVLEKIKKEEAKPLIDGITKAGEAVCAILNEGAVFAMNMYNKRKDEREAVDI